MTHNNRGRLAVAIGGNWRLYTNTIPAGSRALGTVAREGYDTGALVLIEATSLYVQVNAGAVRSLPQSKVVAALAEVRTGQGGAGRGQGRKAADGDGDLSLGIRRAAVLVKSHA